MNITDVRVRKVNDEGKMKAVVSITFDDEFVVHDIKIIEGQNGLFIAMPSRKMGECDFRDELIRTKNTPEFRECFLLNLSVWPAKQSFIFCFPAPCSV